MKCPICVEADLLMTERMGIEIDYCPKCRGVWLDRGELDKFIAKAEEKLVARPPVVKPPEFREDQLGKQTYDPAYQDRQNSERERLERERYERELSERERYERERAARELRERDSDYPDRHYRGKKRESFWGELFDFD
ncbi:MAG: zf-TFIIB domain-containing protein [Planctomycetaceae bacterium]|nr:zf-TFIIB domain-containing protein [Planctomycetaceae bacterium]